MNYFRLRFAFLIPLVLAFVACSSSPPDCTSELAPKEFLDILKTNVTKDIGVRPQDDPMGVLKDYLDELKVQFSDIATVRYDKTSGQRLCEATITVTTAAESTIRWPWRYGFQKFEDGGTRFQTPHPSYFINPAQNELREWYGIRRFNGSWAGTYSCEVDKQMVYSSTTAPAPSFSVPITVDFRTGEVRFDRRTEEGGNETILMSLVDIIKPQGATWEGEIESPRLGKELRKFTARIKDREIVAEGGSTGLSTVYAARCSIKLKKLGS